MQIKQLNEKLFISKMVQKQ